MSTAAAAPLRSLFAQGQIDGRLRWLNPPTTPPLLVPEGLRVRPDGKTDFWQVTHYGFRADNGHVLCTPFAGDFVLTTHITMRGSSRYDQAGLMVRCSPHCWLKTSVEFEPDGPHRLGAVVTNHGHSDWSTQDYDEDPINMWLRVRREANDYIVEASRDGQQWSQIRMARLLEDAGAGQPVECGLYACAPTEAGFRATFEFLAIEPGRVK